MVYGWGFEVLRGYGNCIIAVCVFEGEQYERRCCVCGYLVQANAQVQLFSRVRLVFQPRNSINGPWQLSYCCHHNSSLPDDAGPMSLHCVFASCQSLPFVSFPVSCSCADGLKVSLVLTYLAKLTSS